MTTKKSPTLTTAREERYRRRHAKAVQAIENARAARVALIREMRDDDGLSFATISRLLDIDSRAVRVHYHGGRRVSA